MSTENTKKTTDNHGVGQSAPPKSPLAKRLGRLLGRPDSQTPSAKPASPPPASPPDDTATPEHPGLDRRVLAHIIHELRTPLNGVIGMLELIEPGDVAEPKDEYLVQAKRSSATLLQLINDLLDLSKFESGEMELESVPFDLPALIDDIGTSHVLDACNKQIRLRLIVDSDIPEYVQGDPLRLRQVLTNLINNAIKFTEEGEVVIYVRLLADTGATARIAFQVTDTGVGISGDKQAQIFEPFSQAHASTTRTHGGTGLGLPICAQLVRLMGGELLLDSTPSKGSAFRFELELDLPNSMMVEESQLRTKPVPRIGDPRETQSLARPKILVAEDNEVNRLVVVGQLKSLGYRVDTVENGQEALDALEPGHRYAMVLMDAQMPVLDGYDATRQLRDRELTSGTTRIPVVALSAHTTDEHRKEALSAGMADYLCKPYTIDELRTLIERFVPASVDETVNENCA